MSPQELKTFAVLPLSALAGASAARAGQEDRSEELNEWLKNKDPQTLQFAEELLRDYLTMRGYNEVPAEQADFVAFVWYSAETAERYVRPRIAAVPRYIPGTVTTGVTNIYGSRGYYGQAQSQYRTSGTWTTDTAVVPGYVTQDFVVSLFVNLAYFDIDGNTKPIWSGVAFTLDGTRPEYDAIDFIWAALDRFGSRVQKVTRGALQIRYENDGNEVLVTEAPLGSAGHKGGIRKGDHLLKIDGNDMRVVEDMAAYCACREAGTSVSVTLRRKGSVFVKDVILGERVLVNVRDY